MKGIESVMTIGGYCDVSTDRQGWLHVDILGSDVVCDNTATNVQLTDLPDGRTFVSLTVEVLKIPGRKKGEG
jgi:hypothetical protein